MAEKEKISQNQPEIEMEKGVEEFSRSEQDNTPNSSLEDVEKGNEQVPMPEQNETLYPEAIALFLIIMSLMLAMFLTALDRTILATAVPHITDQFDSLDDVAWYATSYLITASAMQLLYGRIYKFYSTKWTYMTTIFLFEVGSLVCASAPNSIAFICGRAITGLGAAGIQNGGMIILMHTVPLHRRALFSGLFGAIFGIASVLGPIVGGALTDSLSWRWCFWINLPIGGLALVLIFLILHIPNDSVGKEKGLSLPQQLLRLDPIGTACFLPGIICLILALQWGGTSYAWNSGRVIALLTVFSVLAVSFVAVQIWKGEAATVPPRIFRQRSMLSGMIFTFCSSACMMTLIYFLALWFQAVKGSSAFHSGLQTLPLVLALSIASIISGILTTRVGYYVPAMFFSAVAASTGAGLITTFNENTGHGEWIGYQFLYGFGIGSAMQVTMLTAQAVLEQKDAAIGIALMFFAMQLGGSIFVAVGENLFLNSLVKNLSGVAGLDANTIINTGATDLRTSVAEQYIDVIVHAYNQAVRKTFVLGLCLACITIIPTFTMEWKDIRKGKKPVGPDQEQKSEDPSLEKQ